MSYVYHLTNDEHKIFSNMLCLEKVGPPRPDAVFSRCFDSDIISDLKQVFNVLEDMSDTILANNRFVYKGFKIIVVYCTSLDVD